MFVGSMVRCSRQLLLPWCLQVPLKTALGAYDCCVKLFEVAGADEEGVPHAQQLKLIPKLYTNVSSASSTMWFGGKERLGTHVCAAAGSESSGGVLEGRDQETSHVLAAETKPVAPREGS